MDADTLFALYGDCMGVHYTIEEEERCECCGKLSTIVWHSASEVFSSKGCYWWRRHGVPATKHGYYWYTFVWQGGDRVDEAGTMTCARNCERPSFERSSPY